MLEEERVRQIRDELGHRAWHELALDELARSAGLSRMTLHRRGITREDILAALAEMLEREHQEAALPALSSLAPAPERLAMALRSACEIDERYLGLMEALHGQLPEIYHEPGDGEVLTRGPFIDALKRILQDGVTEGTLAVTEDLDETATLLFNATAWTYREMRNGHRWPPQKAQDRVVHLLIAGMRP
jgi:AcrR family transcriptional regulator